MEQDKGEGLLLTLHDEVDCDAATAYVAPDIPRRTLQRISLECVRDISRTEANQPTFAQATCKLGNTVRETKHRLLDKTSSALDFGSELPW